jgi:hypothetical protein
MKNCGDENGFFLDFVEKATDSGPAQSLLTSWMNLSRATGPSLIPSQSATSRERLPFR